MSRTTQDQKQKRDKYFDYKAITFFGVAFQQLNLYLPFLTLLEIYVFVLLPHRVLLLLVWASLFSLAATCRIIIYFLFLQVLRCFTSLGERHRNAPYDNTLLHVLSFLIQKVPDRRLLGTSPKRIVA